MKNQVVFELFWKFFSGSCCYTPLREGHVSTTLTEDRLAQAEKRLLQRQYELAVKKDLDDLEQKMGLKFDMALEEGDAGIYRGLVEVAGRKYGILEQENQSAKLIKAEHLQSREKGKEMQVEKQIGYRG